MKIVLVTLIQSATTIAPMGSACVAAALGKAGFDAENRLFFVTGDDSGYAIYHPGREASRATSNLAAIADEILAREPDAVGFSCVIANRTATSRLAQILREKKPGLILVAGGPDIHPAANEKSGIDVHKKVMDYLVQGDGEAKAVRLFKALARGEALRNDPGVFYAPELADSQILTGYQERETDLDALPFPDFGLQTDFSRFEDERGFWAGIPVSFSRGCTGNCSFCNRHQVYRGLVHRSGESVFHEIAYECARHHADRFILVDDDPLAPPCIPEIKRLARLLIQNKSPYRGMIYNARVSRGAARPGLARLLRKAGFVSIQFGVESFSRDVRKHMGKPASDRLINEIIRRYSRAELAVGIYLIYGYPAETEAGFLKTLSWLEKNMGLLTTVNVNAFWLNDDYKVKRPGTFEYVPPRTGETLSFWTSPEAPPEARWSRYERLNSLLKSRFKGFYTIADPEGRYSSGGIQRGLAGRIRQRLGQTFWKLPGARFIETKI